jgi:hypothetical protein
MYLFIFNSKLYTVKCLKLFTKHYETFYTTVRSRKIFVDNKMSQRFLKKFTDMLVL